jgi:hypothetical protein
MMAEAVPTEHVGKEITAAKCGFCGADPFPIGIIAGELPNGMYVMQIFCSNCRAVVMIMPVAAPQQPGIHLPPAGLKV